MGRVLGNSGEVQGSAGDTLVTSIDSRVQGVVEQQLDQTMKTARKTFDKVTHKNYVADSGSVVVLDAKNGRVVAMAGAPTYDPKVWVGGITSKQLSRLYSAKADNPLLFRATQGQFAPGSTWKPIMTTGALNNGFSPEHPARLLVRLPGRQPLVQELRVRVLRLDRVRPGPADLLRHVLLPRRLPLLAAVRHRRGRRERQGPAGEDGQSSTASASPPASTSPVRPAAGSPTGTGRRPTGRPTRATTARSARSRATTSCTSSPASSASTATPTAPVTPSTT